MFVSSDFTEIVNNETRDETFQWTIDIDKKGNKSQYRVHVFNLHGNTLKKMSERMEYI